MDFFAIIGAIGTFINTLPIFREIWRWLWERDMEVELREPHSQFVRGPTGLNIPGGKSPIFTVNVGKSPYIYMWLDLVLTNHGTTRRKVITNCELHLKRRRWLFWNHTIASAPVLVDKGIHDKTAWEPVIIDPISPPIIITVLAEGPINYPLSKLPRRMKLVIEFSMVGIHRRMRRTVKKYRHDPHIVTNNNQQ